jgi:flagellar protein FliJ
MPTHSVLHTLIGLTSKDAEDAAKRLAQALRKQKESQQKLDLLHSYRQEYVTQLETQMSRGLTMAGYRNFNRFIEGLERAIAQQNQTHQQTTLQVENERKIWQQHEQKRLSYNTLVERAQRQAQHKTNRLEQKQTDEQAARRRSQWG